MMRPFISALEVQKITLISLVIVLAIGFSGCVSVQPSVEKSKVERDAEAKAKAVASGKLVSIEKQGFLSIDTCVKAGAFVDCYLENYMCGSDGCFKEFEPGVFGDVQLVLYLHKEGHTYNIEASAVAAQDIDMGINRNDVTVIGEYDKDTNTIYALEFKAPPPPKKSFFKGCL